jgi:transposase-like protein
VSKISRTLVVEAAMGRQRNAAKWELWGRRLREFDRGHATVSEFCRRLGVSVATFYQWQRKLSSAANGAARTSTAVTMPAAKPGQATGPIHFLPVEITAASQVEVSLPGGARLSIPSREHDALRTVVAALLDERGEDRPC